MVHEGQGYPQRVLKMQGWLEGLEAQWDRTADLTFLLARPLALYHVGRFAESPDPGDKEKKEAKGPCMV